VWTPAIVVAVVIATVRVALSPAHARIAGSRGK
jgi:hypothetical protein